MLTLDIKDQLFLFNRYLYTTPLQYKGTKALKFKFNSYVTCKGCNPKILLFL